MAEFDSTFLLEIPSKGETGLFRATRVTVDGAAGTIVQAIDTAIPSTPNYWTDWGGNYDNVITTTDITIYINGPLKKVDTVAEMLATPNSSVVVGAQVYFNIPNYLWSTPEADTSVDGVLGYSTNVRNPLNPSDDTFGGKRYPTLFRVPDTSQKLPDPINGVNISPTFSARLINSNGEFDDLNPTQFLNGPIEIKRSVANPAELGTFTTIRVGSVENIEVNMDEVVLTGADYLRAFDQSVTRTFKDAGISDSSEDLPIAYGVINGAGPIEFSRVEDPTTGDTTVKYVVCDPDYLEEIVSLSNSDGDQVYGLISIPEITVESGIITLVIPSGNTDNLEPTSASFIALLRGGNSAKLGDVIIKEVVEKAGIPYADTDWNTVESSYYANRSPQLSVYYESGTLKQFITDILKSDMAFLIQQNDGRLSLRKWGDGLASDATYGKYYALHQFPREMITKKPRKKYSDHKYFYSSTSMEYGTKIERKDALVYDDEEGAISHVWNKTARGSFKTNLANANLVTTFSKALLSRFGRRAEVWTVSLGQSTATVELLDTLVLPIVVGEPPRVMSTSTAWAVVGINPSQDTLTLEELPDQPDTPTTGQPPIPLSHPFSEQEPGFLAQPTSDNESGYLAQATEQ